MTGAPPSFCGDFAVAPLVWGFKIQKEVVAMNEEAKSRVAQFRFGVIHDLIGDRKLEHGERKRLLQEKSACIWEIPYSERSFISVSTILDWVRRYEKGGRRLESLYPEERKDKGRPRVLDEETVLSLIELRKQLQGASMPVIMREARSRKILHPGIKAHPVTIYRLFRERGLLKQQEVTEDRRRFEAELPNDIWQSDCMHGPQVIVEGKARKAYLFAFIDDMSRLVPHASFYLNERVETYVAALRIALAKRGLPRKLYVDNGPAFRSQLLSHATAALGIALIHSKPYQPQGRGKIERFFRTVRMQFLPGCPAGVPIDQVNESFTKWLEEQYHATIHSSTKQTPINRYLKHAHLVREAPKDLHDYFRIHANRKVDRDRTVSLCGRLYEAPIPLIGKTITLLYHENDLFRVEAFYNGVTYGMLVPLNMNINCRIRRENSQLRLLPKSMPHEPDYEKYTGGKLFGEVEHGL
jgi:transposase InsO family protein